MTSAIITCSTDSKILSELEVNSLMNSISNSFPSCVAAAVADNDGFLIGSHNTKIAQKKEFDENLLALQTVSNRKFIDSKGFYKYIKSLSDEINLILIAKKDRYNLVNYNRMVKTLKNFKSFF